MKYTYLTLLAFVFGMFIASVAYAQEAVESVTQIDLIPLFEILLNIIGAVVVAGLIVLMRFISKKTGIDLDQHEVLLRNKLEDVVDQGVAFGIQKLDKADWTKLSTRNKIVGEGVNYVIDTAPELVEKFGLTPEKVEKIVLAKLNAHDPAKGLWVDDTEEVKESTKDTSTDKPSTDV